MKSHWMKVIFLTAMSVLVMYSDAWIAAAGEEKETFRVMPDPSRGRSWALGLDAVRVREARTGQVIRKIEIPGWMVARTVCAPDLVLDRSGSAYVSNNAQPKLWRIDGDSFELKEMPIILMGRERWDVGFGALAFAADGSLLALTSAAGTLWHISADRRTARLVDPGAPFSRTCAIGTKHLRQSFGSK